MEKKYDYIIIGGGPSGLSAATMLSKINKSVLLIDSNTTLGGCHRVDRMNGLFSHHSPMVYTDSAVNFRKFLKEINFDFYDNFKKYNFSLFSIFINTLFKEMGVREYFYFFKDFMKTMLIPSYLKDISIGDYMEKNNFNEKTIDTVDRLCRLSDGGDAFRYSANNFFQLPNQNIFYNLYQPKIPNDIGLFEKWKCYLLDKKVNIILNQKVIKLNEKEKYIYLENQKKYNYKRLILCIPLKGLSKLVDIPKKFVKEKSYNEYISITFHYNKKIDIKNLHGYPKSEWGVYFVIQSDYTNLKGTVISTTISKLNSKSNTTNKTANETKDISELKKETFNQLKGSLTNLPIPDFSILNKNVYRDSDEWKTKDSSFLITPHQKEFNIKEFLDYNLKDDLYTIGTHTGKSFYKATSIETAITNSINIMNLLEPDTRKYFTPSSGIYLKDIISVLCVILILFIIIKI